ncbi:cyclic GMP-AMP synthase-like receptor isoform X2 [Dermacentor andersoni]|uniref:cyclic GMP-AMP synthase-like receptor isoform X2 n=1 Tax=Dermacentor andersoni TaxID=34620 RepID=UPI00215522F4|nr:cyclic GMP-AMP synthase-like receptor isoform X2 [Dermacentor andersoni]
MAVDVKPEHYMQRLHEALSKDNNITERNKSILNKVLKNLCEEMKEDRLFALIFKRLYYTGSSYEGLRIRQADEFDINLVMKLPVQEDDFKLVAETPGHVSYTLTTICEERLRETMKGPEINSLYQLFSEDLKFQPLLWQVWLQSVMDKALVAYKLQHGNDDSEHFELTVRQSGPARTLLVHLRDGSQIDIDLVPVLEHDFNCLPTNVPRQKWFKGLLKENDKKWFMVPKPPKDNQHLWRIHFPDAEKKLIKDLGCIKPTIRLLKALRDKHKWPLSSYSIKTVVMHHRLENRERVYWQNDHQWTVLLDVLKRLHAMLRPSGPGICSLFDNNVSLIQDMADDTRTNIAQRLLRISNSLANNPEKVLGFFLETSAVTSENSPTMEKNLSHSLSSLSLTANEASTCDISSDSWAGSRDSSFVDGFIDKRTCSSSPVRTSACMNDVSIVIILKVVRMDTNHQNADNNVQVKLSVLVDEDHLLAESCCSTQGCPEQELKIFDKGLTAPSLLVLKQRFELTGKAAPPTPVQTELSVMIAGRQLLKFCMYLQLQLCVEECQVRLPFPRMEQCAKL